MDHADLLKRRGPYAAAGLAFVAGFADTASFVGADGVFCAHVTGNFVLFAASIARGASVDDWLKLATFPIFVIAVFLATTLFGRLERTSASTSRSLVIASAILLAAAAGLCVVMPCDGPGIGRNLVVAMLVLAMGIQNAMHRLHPKLGPMSTVMTGNVTGFVVDKIRPPTTEGAKPPSRVALLIVGFAAGCAAGAFSVVAWGLVSVAIPAALMFVVCVLIPRAP